MKKIKLFEEFLNEYGETEKTKDMSFFYPIEKWIKEVNNKANKLDDNEREKFWNTMEVLCGEGIAKIIDAQWSDDKMHYHQELDSDVKELRDNFKKIKQKVDNLLKDIETGNTIIDTHSSPNYGND